MINAAKADTNVGLRPYTIFVIQKFELYGGEPVAGVAFNRTSTATQDQAYTNTAFINVEGAILQNSLHPKQFTLGHELGHLLTNNGHYGGTGSGYYGGANLPQNVIDRNLMRDGTFPDNVLQSSKRLTREQEKMILKQLGQ